VVDPEEAARSELGRVISQAVAAAGEGFAGWAVRVEDVATVTARLRLGRDAVGRGGQTAALAGLAEALHTPTLPFFIQRSGPPGTADADAPAIDWLEVSGDAGALSDWLEGAKLPVRVVDGEPEVRRLSVGGRILG
jgi:hypothetical protein